MIERNQHASAGPCQQRESVRLSLLHNGNIWPVNPRWVTTTVLWDTPTSVVLCRQQLGERRSIHLCNGLS